MPGGDCEVFNAERRRSNLVAPEASMNRAVAAPSALGAALVNIQSLDPDQQNGAYAAFQRQHGPMLRRLIIRACFSVCITNPSDHEDIVQEVMMRILRPKRRYDGIRSARRYIYWLSRSIADGAKRARRTTAYERITAASHDGAGTGVHAGVLPWGDGVGVTKLVTPDRIEAIRDARAILASEPTEVREIAELIFWDDLTVRQIGDTTGRHASTVSRAMTAFYRRARARSAA